QAGEARGDGAFADHALEGRLHEQRLIVDRGDVQLGRHQGADVRQGRLDPVDYGDRGDRAGLVDGAEHRAAAVDVHHVGLGRIDVVHVGHVADVDVRAIGRLDRQVVEVLDRLGRVVEVDGVLELADLGGAGGCRCALGGEG